MAKLYLIGSLRNEAVPSMAGLLRRDTGWEIFDAWYSAGPEADDYWKAYGRQRDQSYAEALADYPAEHVFSFDKHHLDTSDAAVLLLPAGRSGHLELGYMVGRGRPAFIHLDQSYLEEGRWDVMYRFATGVTETYEQLVESIKGITVHLKDDGITGASF